MENKSNYFLDTVNPERKRTYKDFHPFCKWKVEVYVDGFREQHLRDPTSKRRILTIDGERPLNEIDVLLSSLFYKKINSNTWSRFHQEIKLPEDCDPNKVSTKVAKGVLTITMPRINTRSRFHKEIKFPEECDPNKVSTKVAGGILTVTMPQKANVGKGIAVKFVVAFALVVALGFGAYLVKYYKHRHCPPLY